jgi:glycosyltransferase involved in cell wall biosynthesis
MQKKSLIIIGFKSLQIEPRGIERVIVNQIDALHNYSIMMVHFGNPKIYDYDNIHYVAIGKNLFSISIKKIIYIYIWKFRNKADVCSHNLLLGSIFLSKFCYVHDLVKNNNRYNLFFFKLLKCIEYFSLIIASHIITISETRVNEIKNLPFFRSKVVKLLYNSTNLIEGSNAKKVFNYKDVHTIKLLSVRSLEIRSNLFWLIDLIVELNKHGVKKYELNIVGGGILYNKLKDYIINQKIHNCVILSGYVSDSQLIDFYLNCDAVLVPAMYDEGFGLPVIESYSANKPAFVANVDALPEIVISNRYVMSVKLESSRDIILKYFENFNFSDDFIGYFNKNFSYQSYKYKINEIFK